MAPDSRAGQFFLQIVGEKIALSLAGNRKDFLVKGAGHGKESGSGTGQQINGFFDQFQLRFFVNVDNGGSSTFFVRF
jgi:hypothetical protein